MQNRTSEALSPWASTLSKVLSKASLVIFVIAYVVHFLRTAMLPLFVGNPFINLIFSNLIACLALMLPLILALDFFDIRSQQDSLDQTRQLTMLCVRAVVAAISIPAWIHSSAIPIWTLFMLAVALAGQDEKRLLKLGLYIGASIVLVFFFLSMLDLVENNRGNSFGFIYRTHYACHLLALCLAYCLLNDGRMTWKGELGLVAFEIINICFVHGKTLIGCLFLVIVVTFWRHYRTDGKVPYQSRELYGPVIPPLFKALYLPIVGIDRLFGRIASSKVSVGILEYSYLICAGVYLLSNFLYRPMKGIIDLIPGFPSVKARLRLGIASFEEFPITLFGQDIPQWGNSGSEGVVDFYYAIDSAYVKILLEFGLVAFVLTLALMTLAQVRLRRSHRHYAIFLLAIFALDGTMEYWMFDVSYNLFILLAFCKLSEPTRESLPETSAHRIGWRTSLIGVALTVAAGLWLVSAYQISTWSGWVPYEGTTLVIPGSFMEAFPSEATQQKKLERAQVYLTFRRSADCIIYAEADEAEQMQDWLTEQGIDPGRIRLARGDQDLDSMLVESISLIENEGLQPRLTVCAFAMQQARVTKHAAELGVAANGLPADMPAVSYLPNYAIEQWRILFD